MVVTEILSPTTVLKVKNEGFYFNSESKNEFNNSRLIRGDLYVKFDIVFPKELTNLQKDNLKDILED